MSDVSEYNVGISRGVLISSCKNCHQAMTGEMDSDEEEFKLECVSCGFKAQFLTEELNSFILEATYEG